MRYSKWSPFARLVDSGAKRLHAVRAR